MIFRIVDICDEMEIDSATPNLTLEISVTDGHFCALYYKYDNAT